MISIKIGTSFIRNHTTKCRETKDFFGFFSSYWEYKLQQVKEDERLIENRLRAKDLVFQIVMICIWLGSLIIVTILPTLFVKMQNTTLQLSLILLLISFSFAAGAILQSYLTYKYDTEE